MPFRERVKKVFARDSSSGWTDGSSLKLKKTNTGSSSADPAPKYRGPVDPQHQERLEAFAFASSGWRRKSHQSQYSPFGSRMPSRSGSMSAEPHKASARGPSHIGHVVESVDDFDASPTLVGPRNRSTSGVASTAATDSTADEDTQASAPGFAHDHKPFTEADVSAALEKVASKLSAS